MSSGSSFDLPAKRSRVAELRELAGAPDLWSDQARAQQVTRELSRLEGDVQRYEELEALADDLLTANELATSDESFEAEVEEGLVRLRTAVADLETELLFSGEYDDHDALLAIHAGEGGTDAQDFAEMMLRMYLRWAEAKGFEATVRDSLEGDEAGIKSATVEILGHHAYGLLRSERGVHRLVRLSPFDSAHRRQTSFASVDVVPELAEGETDIVIEDKDLRVDTFRAGGPGGQHVNTTDSAVRLTHLPTGLVTSCQSERSQLQNKTVAMKNLVSLLAAERVREREAHMTELRGEQMGIGFGSAIRSYVLHPYQLVKDKRTDHETGNTQAVLDGDLDAFMLAYLRAQGGER